MEGKRETLSKKMRFEVFKRDSFVCQYCGNSSPEVILEVDHIKPVSKGGDDSMTNLITSCFDCNRGKSNIELSDNAMVTKQHKQLEELNERRNQIEMMMRWREELASLDDDILNIFCLEFEESTNTSISESGKAKVAKWLKKYNLSELLESLDKSVSQYGEAEKIFEMIPRIAYFTRNPKPQYLQDIYYMRGIMRNRYNYVNDHMAIELMKKAYEFGLSIDEIKSIVFDAKNWTQFKNEISLIVGENDGGI